MARVDAQKVLVDHWMRCKAIIDRIGGLTLSPDDPYRFFTVNLENSTAAAVHIDVGPVVFTLPEYATQKPNLLVHLRGFLKLDDQELNQRRIRTTAFGTEVAYFRKRSTKLQHVFGAHYDHHAANGHPVFHCQMQDYVDRHREVEQECELTFEEGAESFLQNVLKHVRVPIAQMDFFSCALQLCADHLLYQNSSQQEFDLFRELRDCSASVVGAGYQIARFQAAASCMRGTHWYP